MNTQPEHEHEHSSTQTPNTNSIRTKYQTRSEPNAEHEHPFSERRRSFVADPALERWPNSAAPKMGSLAWPTEVRDLTNRTPVKKSEGLGTGLALARLDRADQQKWGVGPGLGRPPDLGSSYQSGQVKDRLILDSYI